MSRRRWRASALVVEAARNTVSAPLRTVVLGLGVVLFAASATFVDSGELIAIRDREHQFTEAGGYIVEARLTDQDDGLPRSLSTEACRSAGLREGVERSGSLTLMGPVSIDRLPDVEFQAAVATVEAIYTLGDVGPGAIGTRENSVVVGAGLAEDLGFRADDRVVVDGRTYLIDAVVDFEPRYEQAQRWMILVSAQELDSTQCWLGVRPEQFDDVVAALPSAFPAAAPVEIKRLQAPDSFSLGPVEAVATRVEQFAWIPAALASALLFWAMVWFRRSELALYRLVGTSRAELWLLYTCEAAMLAVPALYVGVAIALGAAAGMGSLIGLELVVILVRQMLACAGLLSLLAGLPVAVTRMDLLSALKEG